MLRALVIVLVALAGVRAQGRVIVIGVDGLDHGLVSEFIAQGHLPALEALAAEGTFAPLRPTNPAQSPTSWASLTTGLNPGRTGIFGFLRRTVKDGRVRGENALAEVVEIPLMAGGMRWIAWLGAFLTGLVPWLLLRRHRRLGLLLGVGIMAFLLLLIGQFPRAIPAPRNLRAGAALWEVLDREGIAVTSLFAPCAFPAPLLEHGHLLCGLGVPDLLGTHGTASLFRAEPVPSGGRDTQMGGREVPLARAPDGGGLAGVALRGPRNPLDGRRLEVPVGLEPTPDGARLEIGGKRHDLAPGRFSPFLPVRFAWSPIFPDIQGLVRFRLSEGGDRLALYQEPVQFDPRRQVRWAPVTSSPEFGAELAESGLFETLGWATATNPYQDGLIDDAAILEDIEGLVARQQAMVLEQLRAPGWRVHFSVLSTPDRVQHVFWRDREPDHPAHVPSEAARRGDLVLKSYREVDALVGRIRAEILAPGDVLLVVSDHGFASFRRAVNLNRWLAEEGWLVARNDGAKDLAHHLGSDILHVDWSKTRAYSLGLGEIFLNLRGREPEGIVDPAGGEVLLKEIGEKLLRLRDGDRPVVRSVRRSREIYAGDLVDTAGDLVVGFERGYRVSWNSCLLGLDEPVIFDNRTRWSGDHCSVDPDLVPGVLFCSRRLEAVAPTVLDVYPTLRAFLGLAPAGGLDGKALPEAGR